MGPQKIAVQRSDHNMQLKNIFFATSLLFTTQAVSIQDAASPPEAVASCSNFCGTKADNYRSCQQICATALDCQNWTWKGSQNLCWLKNASGFRPTSSAGDTSGSKDGSFIASNIDYYGGDQCCDAQ